MAKKHCLTCGWTHDTDDSCPKEAFAMLVCSCGNESLIPVDALCCGLESMHCGTCEKNTDWKIKKPTEEDMKRLWDGWGNKKTDDSKKEG